MKKTIPKYLKIWFKIHFIIDMVFAFPLIFFPQIVSLLDLSSLNTLSTRLVGAALLSIGCSSLLVLKKNIEVYDSLLNLKIIWASAAAFSIMLFIVNEVNINLIPILIIFLVFLGVWIYYKLKIRG